MAPHHRLELLARRVRWLDRYRRALSVVLAGAVWLILSRKLAAFFLVKWPVAAIVTALLAAIVWWIIEAGFAWLLAMWETEHEQIARDRGLPRAELIRRRKK